MNDRLQWILVAFGSMFFLSIFIIALIVISAPDIAYEPHEMALKVIVGCLCLPNTFFFLIYGYNFGHHRSFTKKSYESLMIINIMGLLFTILALSLIFTPQFEDWIIRDNGSMFSIAFSILWVVLLGYFIITIGILMNFFRKTIPKSYVKTHLSVLGLTILIGGSGFIVYIFTLEPTSYDLCVGPSTPPFELPAGAHYNSHLDNLNTNDSLLLMALEKAAWNFLKLRQPCGGFPIYVTDDFCHFYGDGSSPMFPNEISLQSGTPRIGDVYLDLYALEPNPNWLSIATGVGDALVLCQDEENYGFYYNARFYADNRPYQPHPFNNRRHVIYDDDVTQGCIRFLLHLYNVTKSEKYLTAVNKGFTCIMNTQYSWGAWPQRTNYNEPSYQVWSTLNDGLMDDMIRLLWFGSKILPENRTILLQTLNKSVEWLFDVQGNGGSAMQQAWAQQYDFDQQPAWARKFEPPAYDSAETSKIIKLFLELYCEFKDLRYVSAAKAAIDWLNASKITYEEDGQIKVGWARLYEPLTNRPIYGVREWGEAHDPQYSYNINDASTGYSFWGQWGNDAINKWNYFISVNNSTSAYLTWLNTEPSLNSARNSANQSASKLTASGFWIEEEKIKDSVFDGNAHDLIDYLRRI